MKALLRRFWGYTLEILFPSICLRCRSHLALEEEKRDLLCENCFNTIPIYKTVSFSPALTLAAVSSYDNEAIKELIHALKYKKFLAARSAIARLIDKYLDFVDLKNIILGDAIIIPIPLHKKRLRERGFNQAFEIANILGEKLGLVVNDKILVKIKNTAHQTSLKDKHERLSNVRNSFEIPSKGRVIGKTVILVDDVYTSGATMREAAKVLRRAGTRNIIGFVVAKTP